MATGGTFASPLTSTIWSSPLTPLLPFTVTVSSHVLTPSQHLIHLGVGKAVRNLNASELVAPSKNGRATLLSMLVALSHCHPAFPAFNQCSDKHQQCPNWAFAGQCDQNQGFMKVECAQSCDSCGWGPGMLAPQAVRASPGDEAQLMRSRTAGR